jgi:acetolactate synthase-1/2/3 large subunit
VKLADAYGARGLRATKPEELASVLAEGFATPGVVVMDIIVSEEENVYPMIPAGAAHYEIVMAPDAEKGPPEPRELA